MQFTFPSIPTELAASSRATVPSPGAPASNAPDAKSAPDGGFAQVLAGVRKPADAPASAPAVTGTANASGQPASDTGSRAATADQSGATVGAMPFAGAPVDSAVRAGWVVAGAGVTGPLTPDVPGQAGPGDGSDAAGDEADPTPVPSDHSDAKDLATIGDLQALAVAAGLVVPAVQPVTSTPQSADEPTAVAQNVSSPAAGSVLGGGIVSAMMLNARSGAVPPSTAGAGQPASVTAADAPGTAPAMADMIATDPHVAASSTGGGIEQAADPGKSAAVAAQAPADASVPVASRMAASLPAGALGTANSPAADRLPGRAGAMVAAAGISGVTTPAGVAEKFAAVADQAAARVGGRGKPAGKSFVDAEHKEVAQFNPMLGTGTAERDATMPAGSTLTHSNDTAVLAASSSTDAAKGTTSLPQEVTLPSTAHQAVEAVLSAADRVASRTQHSVNLQFNVGGSDLNVRVELRAGEVHTTFRTDSAELRAALSNEWQSVTAHSSSERPTRLAPPVFTANGQSDGSFSGDGASRQRQSDGQPSPQGFGALIGRSAPATSASTNVTSTPVASRSVAANSVHLHTLA
jgi:hypothetical protein